MLRVVGRVWAVTQEMAEELRELHRAGQLDTLDRLAAARGWAGPDRQEARRGGAVAIVPVYGMITQRSGSWGTSTERLTATLRQVTADQAVCATVLEVDSPGGEVYGVAEAAAAIRAARAVKPVVAVASSMAASAAYWLAAQADEFLVTPSGDVGSVGVYGMHIDVSKALEEMGIKVTLLSAGKYKVENTPYAPLGDDAAAAMQTSVNRHYAAFVGDVAKGRKVSPDAVRGGFGEGRLVGAKAAVDGGMADSVGGLDEAIRRAAYLGGQRRAAAASVAQAQGELIRRTRA